MTARLHPNCRVATYSLAVCNCSLLQGHSCAGKPSAMVGQPAHAAVVAYSRAGSSGPWSMDTSMWIVGPYKTTGSEQIPTDDVPGANKNRAVSVDHMQVTAQISSTQSSTDYKLLRSASKLTCPNCCRRRRSA